MYNYRKLIGRIVEMFETRYAFANAMGMSERSLSAKLNNESDWDQSEIMLALKLLKIPIRQIQIYFFDVEVQ